RPRRMALRAMGETMASDRAEEIRQDLLSSTVHVAATMAGVLVFAMIAWRLRSAGGGPAAVHFSNGFMLFALAQLVPPSASGFLLTMMTGRANFPGANGFQIVLAMAQVALIIAGALACFEGAATLGAASA
ncbi:MAG: hypothetical protein AAFX85_14040, partial [Pseudomonadota bacterium]